MTIEDWDIFGRASPLRREMERFASSLLSDAGASESEDVWAPPVDIYEREGGLVLLVDLPGLAREDIDLQVDSNVLTIQGERSRRPGQSGIRFERPSGRFRRSFRIGVPIDPAGVSASYRSGVLEVTLPKAASAGPARVPIDQE